MFSFPMNEWMKWLKRWKDEWIKKDNFIYNLSRTISVDPRQKAWVHFNGEEPIPKVRTVKAWAIQIQVHPR